MARRTIITESGDECIVHQDHGRVRIVILAVEGETTAHAAMLLTPEQAFDLASNMQQEAWAIQRKAQREERA